MNTFNYGSAAALLLGSVIALGVGGCSEEHDPFYPAGATPAFGVSVTAAPGNHREVDTYYLWPSMGSVSFSGAELLPLISNDGVLPPLSTEEVFVGQGADSEIDIRVEVTPAKPVYEWHETAAEWHEEDAPPKSVHLAVRLGGTMATGNEAHALEFFPGHLGPDLTLNGGAPTEMEGTITTHGVRFIANLTNADLLADNVNGTAFGAAPEPALTGALHNVEVHLHMPEITRDEDPLHVSETKMVRGEVAVTFTAVKTYGGRFVEWLEDLDPVTGAGTGIWRYTETELKQTITHLGAGITMPEHQLTVELESSGAQTIFEGGYPAAIKVDAAAFTWSISAALHAKDLAGHAGGGGHTANAWESQNLPGFGVVVTVLNELSNGSTTVTLAPMWSEEYGLYYGANIVLPIQGSGVTPAPGAAPPPSGGGGGHAH